MGILSWIGDFVHDMFTVSDDHPMTEKEYDRRQAAMTAIEFVGSTHNRIREERQHRELIEALKQRPL